MPVNGFCEYKCVQAYQKKGCKWLRQGKAGRRRDGRLIQFTITILETQAKKRRMQGMLGNVAS